MSVEVKLAELRTIIEQTLGPDGSVSAALGEIKGDIKEGAKALNAHFRDDTTALSDLQLRLDRLEQTQKSRSKLFWTAATAWIGVMVAWAWEHVARK